MRLYRLMYVGLCFIFISGCDKLFRNPMDLSFTVRVVDTKAQVFDVELIIQKASAEDLVVRSYIHEEYAKIEKFEAIHSIGVSLKVDHVEEQQEIREQEFSIVSKVLKNSTRGKIKVLYRVRVGTGYAPHGKQPFRTLGYMCDRFALVAGRSIFLLPEGQIGSARVRFILPDGWLVAVPWKDRGEWFVPPLASPYIGEDLVNTTIALGFLEKQTERIGNTDVSVYVFDQWEKSVKDGISKTAFSLYKSVVELFGADGIGKYQFIFTPETQDGLSIYTRGWSSSQGMEMDPPTAERWLSCAEKLIDRWIKYPPFRMTYKAKEDFWVLDGIRAYYAIQICDKLGLLNGPQYLESQRKAFIPNAAWKNMATPFSSMKDYSVSRLMDVRRLYTDDSGRLKRRRDQITPTVMAFIDEYIQEQSKGKYRFVHVLQYQYGKRHGLNLLGDIEHVVGDEIARHLTHYLHDLTKIARKIGIVEHIPLPPHSQIRTIDPIQTDTLRILFTGNTKGFLEHCGCKANQNGGVARRANVIKKTREKFLDLLVIDLGNLFPFTAGEYRLSSLTSRELKLYLATMEKMKYDLTAVSYNELLYGSKFLFDNISSVNIPFVCANVLKDGMPIARPHVSISVGKYKLGFLGVFQPVLYPFGNYKLYNYIFQDRTHDLTFVDPVKSIQRYLPQLRKENDLVVLISNFPSSFIHKQTSLFDGIDFVISSTSHEGRLFETEQGLSYSSFFPSGFHNGRLTFYETAGLYAIDFVELWVNREVGIVGWHRRRMHLSDDIEADFDVRTMIDDFYSSAVDGVTNLEPLMTWDKRFTAIQYVGAEVCQSCHSKQYSQWKTTSHAYAMNTLLDVRRHYQPKCVICHVTGGGYETGYKMGDLDHHLINVQCEMCHGPGGNHIKRPTIERMLRTPSAKHCITCHDQEHSDFNFSSYYPQVKH